VYRMPNAHLTLIAADRVIPARLCEYPRGNRNPWRVGWIRTGKLSRQGPLAHSARLGQYKASVPVAEVSSSGEVGEMLVEDTQGA
jgi:hypothetical protein